jgi:diguanylate cyclase (GGDEF)-like protein
MSEDPRQALPGSLEGQRDRVLRKRIGLLYGAVPISLFGTVVGAGLAVLLISRGNPTPAQSAWLLLALAISALRLIGYRHFCQGAGADAPLRRRLRAAVSGEIAAGVIWGAASLVLFSSEDPATQSILAFLIAGISAGAVGTLLVFPWAAVTVVVLVLTPFALQLLWSTDLSQPAVAVLCLAYGAALSVWAHRLNRGITNELETRLAQQRAEASLEHQAYYDRLTGLPNARLVTEHLRQDLAAAGRWGRLGALIVIDIDRFKAVNHSLGSEVGNAVLRTMATRLARELNESQIAGRRGSDEFLVLLAEVSADPVEVAHVARQTCEQLKLALSEPIRIDAHELQVNVSMGIAIYPSDGDEPAALIRAAGTAMHRAKEEGGDKIRFFLPEMQAAALARMELQRALRDALTNDELELYFQPQVDRDGRVVAAEALARWPRAGILDASPDRFVPAVEESGLIHVFGNWVLDHACAAMSAIRSSPGGETIEYLAVNISPRQFRAPGFVDELESLLHHYGLEPWDIELELTERTLVADMEATCGTIQRLRSLGIRFAIDDFGTGYSSLSYLKHLPVDALKIDRSFVRNAVQDASDQAIVRAIVSLGTQLGLQVIAEGVDSAACHRLLADQGCDGFQGFHFFRPMALGDLLHLIYPSRQQGRGTRDHPDARSEIH